MTGLASEVSGEQMVEFTRRLGRFGMSLAEYTQLLGDDDLMKAWVKARHGNRAVAIAASPNTIDLDVAPFVPDGWKIVSHRSGGQIEWSKDIFLPIFTSKFQKNGIDADDLRVIVEELNVPNANVLDWLLDNPHRIPRSWKGKTVFFWGTIYLDPSRRLCVRFLYWKGSKWTWGYSDLEHEWNDTYPAAILR